MCLPELCVLYYVYNHCSCQADLRGAALFAETGGNEQKIYSSSEVFLVH